MREDPAMIIVAASVLAGAVAAVSGFGIGSLLTPVLVLSLGMPTAGAVAVLAIPHAVATAIRLLRLRRGSLFGRRGRTLRAGRGLVRPGARRRHLNGNDLAGIGRDHGILVEIVEFASGFGADALGAKFRFGHGRVPSNLGASLG